MKARVCLVSPGHPSCNPRLVKEADALHAAGHQVTVVHGRYFPLLDPFDSALLASRPWPSIRVDHAPGPRVFIAKLRHRLARRLVALRPERCSLATALLAHHVALPALAAAARKVPADLVIGHCLAGLAAAGLAAARTHARLGFDAEDFHSAETVAATTDPVERAVIAKIEAAFLPRCRHLTAASPLIGRAYAELYSVHQPVTVLNTFPLSEAPPAPVSPERPGGLPLLYWFSQTIGPGRGLEPLLHALARLPRPCVLRLRGLPAHGYPDALRSLARSLGFAGTLDFAPVAPPAEMARLAASADLGLSLEQTTPRNRDLCLTNKIFTYLLAGVPVALTPTSAQSALAPDLGPAALLLDLAAPDQAAAALHALLSTPDRLASARSAAWSLGHDRFCWDREQASLLASVQAALL